MIQKRMGHLTYFPVQTYIDNTKFANVNVTFGSRFDFSIFPNSSFVASGTEGVSHDNTASYIIGLSPIGVATFTLVASLAGLF